ncbi:hypothetical protein CEXT_133441 [Caerostris extrusa]|uniref:Uncharacterized protein n=1 Tax=Caerostris extrusa TaxID=172846 RepID=A0AAV4MEK9_CAEEX|nr:hypothetical protein CEXT_133441 [Caerostris extrusa]
MVFGVELRERKETFEHFISQLQCGRKTIEYACQVPYRIHAHNILGTEGKIIKTKTARKVAAREVRAIKVRGPCLRWPRGMRRTPNGKCGQLSVTGPLMAGDTHWVGLQATMKNNRQVIARYSFSHSQHCFSYVTWEAKELNGTYFCIVRDFNS